MKWVLGATGEVVIAHNRNPVTQPGELPIPLLEALDNLNYPAFRQAAAKELGKILASRNRSLALAAELKFKQLLADDSFTIREISRGFLGDKARREEEHPAERAAAAERARREEQERAEKAAAAERARSEEQERTEKATAAERLRREEQDRAEKAAVELARWEEQAEKAAAVEMNREAEELAAQSGKELQQVRGELFAGFISGQEPSRYLSPVARFQNAFTSGDSFTLILCVVSMIALIVIAWMMYTYY